MRRELRRLMMAPLSMQDVEGFALVPLEVAHWVTSSFAEFRLVAAVESTRAFSVRDLVRPAMGPSARRRSL